MPQSKFFAKFRLPGPGPYDLVSTDAEVADYHVLKQKILADEEKRKQARRMLKMESRESGMKGMRRRLWNGFLLF